MVNLIQKILNSREDPFKIQYLSSKNQKEAAEHNGKIQWWGYFVYKKISEK